ncbi:hypothetical protein LEN26_021054 [Aphanomyces euteiches]|nr:hypothetical protein LEN26_021054 [Aphanomyces euteiches]KAH9111847.1 hypothetical protein AeMF1_013723 [Aphanomyces euteiches]
MHSYLSLRQDAIISMTNFTNVEFDILWGVCEEHVHAAWYDGRGRIFMLLCVMKHYDSWDRHALDFGMRTPTFEKVVMRILNLVEPYLFEQFVRPIAMKTLLTTSKRIQRFPGVLYAIDVKFQPTNRPSGTFDDAKRYFSGKHNLYGYKLEASVSPSGKYLLLSSHRPGAVFDLIMFVDRLETHRINLRMTLSDRQIVSVGEGGTPFPNRRL